MESGVKEYDPVFFVLGVMQVVGTQLVEGPLQRTRATSVMSDRSWHEC